MSVPRKIHNLSNSLFIQYVCMFIDFEILTLKSSYRYKDRYNIMIMGIKWIENQHKRVITALQRRRNILSKERHWLIQVQGYIEKSKTQLARITHFRLKLLDFYFLFFSFLLTIFKSAEKELTIIQFRPSTRDGWLNFSFLFSAFMEALSIRDQ